MDNSYTEYSWDIENFERLVNVAISLQGEIEESGSVERMLRNPHTGEKLTIIIMRVRPGILLVITTPLG